MEIKIDILTWLISALLIIVLLILMVRFQWGAADATPIALFISLFSGVIYFKAPIDLIAVESSKGIWNSLIVLIVIWPAILIYEVTREAGAFNTFRIGMKKFT